MPKGTYPEETIQNAYYKARTILSVYDTVEVSLSGGSDSDVMLDLLYNIAKDRGWKDKYKYVFFDTGIEYEATKRHLDYLEQRYGITIDRVRSNVPVPLGCKQYGLPFLSKYVSEMIDRLQSVNFDFANDGYHSFHYLIEKYPNTISALRWWCDEREQNEDGSPSQFSINRFPFLKAFLIENPPPFRISAMCCKGAKKDTAHDYDESHKIELKCTGERKAEGGARASKNSCFDESSHKLKPIFWFDDETKQVYEQQHNIVHSDCYTVYGFKRTGCAGCPFNSRFANDVAIAEKYEPKLAKAIKNIFGQSYEYTEAYKRYKEYRKKNCENQISLDLEVNE